MVATLHSSDFFLLPDDQNEAYIDAYINSSRSSNTGGKIMNHPTG